jgi:circadian clock protein KaiC
MAAERYRTGIPGLDEVMLGGFLAGRSVMIEGYTGTGKTVLGMSLINAGIREFGESGVLVSFEQLPEFLYLDALSFGWDFREL